MVVCLFSLTFSTMDSNFVQKLQNIKLTEDEGEVIRVGTVHRDRMLEECSLSLLGKFLTTKTFNQCAAKTLLRSVWKMGSDVRIVDVGDDVFQFKFSMESQLKWMLANGPSVHGVLRIILWCCVSGSRA